MNLVLLLGLSIFSHPALADIVGGEEVTETDPIRRSTVALYEPSPSGNGGALCTASLIGKDIALTAAHCISPGGPKPILLFGRDLHSPQTLKRAVSEVRVNPRWGSHQGKGMDQGDVAVVQFPGGIPAGYGTIRPASARDPLARGQTAILAGYGISDARTKSGSGRLRRTQVSIDDPRPGKTEMILDQSHGHGACHGDSGGPAFIRHGKKMALAGVTNRSYPASAPDDCAHRVVYTKVSAYQPWIKKTQKELHQKRGSAPFRARSKHLKTTLRSKTKSHVKRGHRSLRSN